MVVTALLTFDSHDVQQRDVEAWTMEEYLAKNARIPECSSKVSIHSIRNLW